MKQGLIFSIQRFCVHDGPGIRTTVFFKGCPLSCQWCHNPESQSFLKEVLLNAELCTLCGTCQKVCHQQAIEIGNNQMQYNRNTCIACGCCEEHCLYNARRVAGREYTLTELKAEIVKDRCFYEQSGGGVTFSGGEAMLQIDFLEDIARVCKAEGLHVAVDTSGFVPSEYFLRILPYVDLFLYDIKLMDPNKHHYYIGQDNALILQNLELLVNKGAKVNLRLPLIEGINTADEDVLPVVKLLKKLPVLSVNILPYHDIAKGKYQSLGKLYEGNHFLFPSDKRLQEIKDLLLQANAKIQIGG